MKKTLFVGLVSTLLLAGCASSEDYKKLDARLAIVEARYYSLDEDSRKIHEYLDQKHENDKNRFAALKKADQDMKSQLQDHDKTIRGWQQGTPQ